MRLLLLAVSLLLLAPNAGANEPNSPIVCDPALGCIAPGVCVSDVYCQSHPCDPVAECAVEAQPYSDCALNQTIEGRTCQTRLGATLRAGRATEVPGVGSLRQNEAGAEAVFSDGDAHLHELPNVWFSHELRVHAKVAGLQVVDTSVGVYRSVILLEPDEGPQGLLFPESNHTFSQVGVSLRHDSAFTGEHQVIAALVFLDNLPEGCYVRSPGGVVPDQRCPRAPLPLA